VDDERDQWRKRLTGCVNADGGHFKRFRGVYCLKFKLLYNMITGYFQSHPYYGESIKLRSDEQVLNFTR